MPGCCRRSGAGWLLAPVGLVLPEGFLQLILEDDDPAGGFQGGALLDHLPGPCGEAQLVAGVATVATGRPERREEFCLPEPAQEVLRGAGDFRGAAHRIGGVVVV